MIWFPYSFILYQCRPVQNRRTDLDPLKPDGRFVADPDPSGMVGHPEPGAGEVDAEPALGTVGEAVAVARLTVGNQRPLNLSGELEVIGWKYWSCQDCWSDQRAGLTYG